MSPINVILHNQERNEQPKLDPSQSLRARESHCVTNNSDGVVETTEETDSAVVGNDRIELSSSAPSTESVQEMTKSSTRSMRENKNRKKQKNKTKAKAPIPRTEPLPSLKQPVSKQITQNPLSTIIPGYTAEMKLSSSLDKYRNPSTGDDETPTLRPPVYAVASNTIGPRKSFKTGKVVGKKSTIVNDAGDGWHRMRSTPLTEELKQDMTLIRNRNYLDPKRFYKSSDPFGKILQVGTVIEGATEFYSSRLTKKERKATLIQEVMADPDLGTYAIRKHRSLQQERVKNGQKHRQVRDKIESKKRKHS